MRSDDSTIRRSVRKTPRGHDGANTFKWGICWNFGMQTTFPRQTAVRAESGDGLDRWLPHYPAVTATGEGRS
jgi:hypothetical protein